MLLDEVEREGFGVAEPRQRDRGGPRRPAPTVGFAACVRDQRVDLREAIEVALDGALVDREPGFVESADELGGARLPLAWDGAEQFDQAKGLVNHGG